MSHVPFAVRDGAEVRANCMVARVNLGKDNRVTGVTYLDENGRQREQRAKAVIVSGYAIETPRLLLNSACAGHEQGLANSSGTLGKYLMAQIGNVVFGRFDEPIRMYKAPPANGLTEEFYETDPRNDFVRGYAIQSVSPLPISFARHMMVAQGAWGWGMRRLMMDYNHWSSLGVLGEILPWEDNTVGLAEEKDRFGLPVAKVMFNLHDNDKKIAKAGVARAVDILRAAGATEVCQEPRYAHLVGGARMGATPEDSVVDGYLRTWDIPNLFICDGSVMPTQGSANPGLTIQALAARLADYLVHERDNATSVQTPTRTRVSFAIHYDLSPDEVAGRGMPRLKSSRPTTIGAGGLGPGTRG